MAAECTPRPWPRTFLERGVYQGYLLGFDYAQANAVADPDEVEDRLIELSQKVHLDFADNASRDPE